MFDLDKWQEIFNTIRKHKLRTFLTALGVFWGIFMLVFLMGAGKGLENGVTGLFGGHAKNSLYIGPRYTSKPYKGLQPGRPLRLYMNDMKAIRNNFEDEIAYIAPRLWAPASGINRNGKSGDFDVRGDTPDLLHIDALEMEEGRFLNQVDLDKRRKVAIIGTRVKEVLYSEGEEVIGTYVKIAGNKYLVVGIIKSNRRGNDALDDNKTIFLPLTTVQQVTNQPNRVGWFVCSMHPSIKVSSVEDNILALLRERHMVAPDDQQAFWNDNIEEEFKEIMGLFAGIRFMVWFVGIGSLIAGVIGVGNIMLIVVKERTKEIGIRKAMGATPGSIISMILTESIFITTIAGYTGLVMSTMLIYVMNIALGEGSEYYSNPEVDLGLGLLALVILVIFGALVGMIPALQAARVNPVIALKDE